MQRKFTGSVRQATENNGIKNYNEEPQPRVVVSQPRVGITVPDQVEEPRLVFACPTEAVVESLKRPIPKYISQDEEKSAITQYLVKKSY